MNKEFGISSLISQLQSDSKFNPSVLPFLINLLYDTSLGLFKAKEYESALTYLREAISLIPSEFADRSYYDLSLKIMVLTGRVQFSRGEFEEALVIFENLQRKVDNPTDLYKVKYYYLETCSHLCRYEIVYDEFMDMLAYDPATLCLVANDDSFLQNWIQETVVTIREILMEKYKSLSDLLELEDIPNRERRYFMKCLAQCYSGITFGRNSNKVYLFVTPLLLGKVLLQEGLCEEMTLPILSSLGWILGSINDPELGAHLSSMAIDVAKNHHKKETPAVMAILYRSYSLIFTDSLLDLAKSAYEGWKLSIELSENIWGPLCGSWVIIAKIYSGSSFDSFRGMARELESICRKLNNAFLLDILAADLAVARGLMDDSMTSFDPVFINNNIEEIPYSRTTVRFARGMWHFFHEDYKTAYICMKETGSLIEDTFGTPIHLIFRWFSCVVCSCRFESYREDEDTDKKKTFSIMEAMLGPNAAPPKSQKEKILDEFKRQYLELEQLHDSFGRFMEAAYYLSQAEAVRLNLFDQCSETSLELYEKAIQSAKECRHPMIAAIACSRLASLPDLSISQRSNFVVKAIKLWDSIGALYMVSQMIKQYQVTDADSILTSSSINSIGFEAIRQGANVSKSFDASLRSYSSHTIHSNSGDGVFVLKPASSTHKLRSSMNGEDLKTLKQQVHQKTTRIQQLNERVDQLQNENEELRRSQQRALEIVEIAKRNSMNPAKTSSFWCLPKLFRGSATVHSSPL